MEIKTPKQALIQALVLAVTAPNDDKRFECQDIAAYFIDELDEATVNDAYAMAEAMIKTLQTTN